MNAAGLLGRVGLGHVADKVASSHLLRLYRLTSYLAREIQRNDLHHTLVYRVNICNMDNLTYCCRTDIFRSHVSFPVIFR